jgi:hypothetical protein
MVGFGVIALVASVVTRTRRAKRHAYERIN